MDKKNQASFNGSLFIIIWTSKNITTCMKTKENLSQKNCQ